MSNHLNAHAKPPDAIREVYKRYQKLDAAALNAQPDLIDPRDAKDERLLPTNVLQLPTNLREIFTDFTGHHDTAQSPLPSVFETKDLPGKPPQWPSVIQLH